MKNLSTPLTVSLLATCAMSTAACLDPLASDDVAAKQLVLPEGSEVPSAHDDPEIEQQIAWNDGVEGTVPLLSGFAAGAPTQYWDFGVAPDFAAPLFALAKRNSDGELEPLSHKIIVDAIPGDPGYSPYWSIFILEVTHEYDGELITSFAAIEEAQAAGLLYAPTLPTIVVNCPTVASDVALDVGDEAAGPFAPPSVFYWQGKTVKYYDLGVMPVIDAVMVTESPMLILSREGQSPLSEPLRRIDITADGDITDTNNVFAMAKGDEDYTPHTRRINVTLPAGDLLLIDTSGDEALSAVTAFSDLFDPEPLPGLVTAFEETDEMRNLPQQSEAGGL